MYGVAFPMSDEALSDNFVIPFGKAKIEREGQHITLVGYSKSVQLCLESAQELEKLGVSAEVNKKMSVRRATVEQIFNLDNFFKVINLRSLRPFDFETIKQSVMKTHHLVTVEQSWPFCSIGAEILAQVMETEAFYSLDGPVLRVTGADVPMPYAKLIEQAALPQVSDVILSCKRSLNME